MLLRPRQKLFVERSLAALSTRANPDAVLAEIAATNVKLDALGLVLDSDPRRVTKTGSAQSKDGASDPATDPAADDTTADDPAADADNDPAQAEQQD